MKTEKEIQDQQEALFFETDKLQVKRSQTREQRDIIVQQLRAINAQVNVLNWVLYGTKIKTI